ncbi:MAG: hypothetical protein Tsb0014_01940 [Pleurocapsa sp.]
MATFSENTFLELFDFAQLERNITGSIRIAVKNPTSLYLFFQRYTYFNAYASAMISRLASTIGLSRYIFSNSELLVKEEADRGMDIAALVMSAAADEGANGSPVHRALAQLTLKTVGDYADLSIEERNKFAAIPSWLDDIIESVKVNYEGTVNDEASLLRAMGFHLASEMLGDREYALLDMVVRLENQGIGFDRYLKHKAKPAVINDHRYTPWSWVVIHSRHDASGAEAEHSEYAISALNMAVRYGSFSEQQILALVQEGFAAFVKLQQQLFKEMSQECLEMSHSTSISDPSSVTESFQQV